MKPPLTRRPYGAMVSPQLLAQFSNSLSYLLNGGVSLRASLNLLKLAKGPSGLKRLIMHLEQALNAGQQLSSAMRAQYNTFGGVAVALVECAERDGSLGFAFSTIGELINKETEYKKSLHTAFAYPAILLVAVLLMLIFVLSVLAPAVRPILMSGERELSSITQLLFWLSGEPALALVILGLAPALLLAFYLLASLNSAAREYWDSFVLRFWLLGDVRRDLQYSRFCNVCARLTYSGLDMDETMAIATGTVDNLTISNELKAVRERMQVGETLSRSLGSASTAPLMLVPLINAAESSGKTAVALERASTQLEQQAHWQLHRFTRVAPSLLVCVLGCLVLAIVIGLLGPIFSTAVSMGVAI